jgi:hypothetical protein
MNLKHLTDETLENDINALVRTERETLTSLLHHLMEYDRRRLYSKYKFRSLFQYLVEGKGYPEDQAYRRIAAMKLLKELPQIEDKITSGSLSLTNLGLASSFFKKETKAFTKIEKLEVLEKLDGKSTREAVRIAACLSSTPAPKVRESVRPVSANESEVKFAAGHELLLKIEKLKGLLAHSNPQISLSDLVDKLCDLGIQVWDPAQKKPRKTAAPRDLAQQKSKAEIKREVWRKAESQCQNCGSFYALEEDHSWPFAMGGELTLQNMRLLCRSCNQRAAIEFYGIEKMDQFRNREELRP